MGGDVGEMTAQETLNIFEMLRANSQQKSARRRVGVNEVSTNHELRKQLAELTKQVQLLALQGAQRAPTHEANICNSIGETFVEQE